MLNIKNLIKVMIKRLKKTLIKKSIRKLDEAYHKAFEQGIGIHGSQYANTMMVELGETLHFAAGSDKNIKLTTKDDLEMFKGYMKMDKDTWLK